jgi:hypothetical protein
MEFVRPQAELCHGSLRRAYTAAMPGFAHVISDPCLNQGDAALRAAGVSSVGDGRRFA